LVREYEKKISRVERVVVLIDGSNILHASRKFAEKNAIPNYKIDYKKLEEAVLGERPCIRTYFFCSRKVPPDPVEQGFQEALQSLGFTVISRPLHERHRQGKRTYVEKGVDVALVTEMLCLAYNDAYDTVVVVSGDGDYKMAIERVKQLGKRVEVASFRDSISRDLRLTADKFIELDSLAGRMKKE
jgi:uncharacterized LabA/DUF88 family protein